MSDIKVKIYQLEDNFIQFSISNIHIGLANAIRRIMIAEVPTMAIDFARIMQNSGCIHDDMIAQRIGLIPFVSTNVDKFDYHWNNSEGLSEVEYELNIINTGDEIIEVTSNDLKIKNVNNYTGYIKNIYKSVTVVDMGYPIVITKLAKGQQLYFICSVRKGISQEHAKFRAHTLPSSDCKSCLGLQELPQTIRAASDYKSCLRLQELPQIIRVASDYKRCLRL